MQSKSTTPADLRAEIARHWDQPLYQLASAIPLHPVTLSAILHEREPLKPWVADRIMTILHDESVGGVRGR